MALDDVSLSLGSCQAAGKTVPISCPTPATLFSKSSSHTFIFHTYPTAVFIPLWLVFFSFANKDSTNPIFAVAYIQRGPVFVHWGTG